MGITELFFIALGLSMDAFAVSVCKGLSTQWLKPRHYLAVGLWFGGFQALMPFIGYLLGSSFESYITEYDHWIAFVLLGILGFNMLREAKNGEAEEADASLGFRVMLAMAVATSIDALAVGISLAMVGNVNIFFAVTLIGVCTCLLSMLGVKIGNVFGSRFEAKAEIAGGVILILLGVKILLEHLGVLA